MKVVRFSEDVRPISDLKARAGEVVSHAKRTRRPVLLTRRGRGVAVVVQLDAYEALFDRASFVGAVAEGARAAAEGDLHPHDEAVAILHGFGRDD